MILVGCDLPSRTQQVAVLDTRTGELVEQALAHEGDAVERFYRALPPPVTIGIETTGYPQWFHARMHQLGHTVLVGEAAKIRAMVVRKTKTDRRDARHLLDLLQHDRFPTVWIPDPDTRDRRALIAHRVRLVRMRTMVKTGDRPQPAAGAPLGVVDPAGARPTEGPGPPPAHDAPTR
jgi:transposase